jgi:hypothetical protein
MDFLIMNKRDSILNLIGAVMLLLSAGCQTFSPPRFQSETTVYHAAEAGTYQADFTLREGSGDQAAVIATPKMIFRAGEPAKIRIERASRVITAEAYIPTGVADPVCIVKTRVFEGTRQIFHHSEVIKPTARR